MSASHPKRTSAHRASYRPGTSKTLQAIPCVKPVPFLGGWTREQVCQHCFFKRGFHPTEVARRTGHDNVLGGARAARDCSSECDRTGATCI
jgi:hypothetical protein